MANNFNKKRKSYFDQSIERYGEDFLNHIPIQQIGKDARKRIFKDMVFGNIDYTQHGKYFTNAEFLNQLIAEAYDLMANNATEFRGLSSIHPMYDPEPVRTYQLKVYHQELMMCYNIIYEILKSCKDNMYNVGILTEIAARTKDFKNAIAQT